MTNVADYYAEKLGRAPCKANLENFRDMPLDSPCGDDCRKAIDTAAAFRAMVIMAYGDESGDYHYPEKAEAVRDLAESVCSCFIVG